jgi:hypothetical protein
MFARLTIYDDVDLELADQVRQWHEAADADPFRELPGYRGSMTLMDRDNARIVGIGFYSSAGHAQEAEKVLAEMFEDGRIQIPDAIRPALDMQLANVGLYEVVQRD